jgi:hypothetical protein
MERQHRTLLVRMLLLCGLVLATSCTPGAPRPQRELVGTLGTAGNAVYVNRAPAQTGTPIFSGDEVATGPGSGAMIDFTTGGFFELDQNTDPIFSWHLVNGVRCILAQIFTGQAYVDEATSCLSTATADVVSFSQINVETTTQRSVLTLLQGRMLGERPPFSSVAAGQEVTIDLKGSVIRRGTLSPAELRQRVAWRGNYRFLGWCDDGRGETRKAYHDECDRRHFSFIPPHQNVPQAWPAHPLLDLWVRQREFQPSPRPAPSYPAPRTTNR